MVMTPASCRGTGYTVFVNNHPSHGDLTIVMLSCVIRGTALLWSFADQESLTFQKVAPYLCSHKQPQQTHRLFKAGFGWEPIFGLLVFSVWNQWGISVNPLKKSPWALVNGNFTILRCEKSHFFLKQNRFTFSEMQSKRDYNWVCMKVYA